MLKKVLIIDSDLKNFYEIAANLQDETTEVQYAATVQIALKKMAGCHFCLIIMDILLSDGGGHAVIAAMRERAPMPILALSEQAETADKVLALESGADDFLAKPYDMDECLARARALLRRYTELNHITQRSYALVSHDILIDTARRTVSMDDEEICLVRKEYELLIYFIKNKDIVLSYEQIYQGVWKEVYLGNRKAISFQVRQLRKKLGSAISIKSLSGIGYCLKLKGSKFFN